MDFFTNTAAPAAAKLSSSLGIGTYVLYALLLVFVVLVVLMLMNIKISLSMLIPRKYSVLASSSKFWTPSGVYTNLTVPSTKAPNIADNAYSITLEGLLFNSRNYQSMDGPYRHIAHRGSKELAATTIGGAVLTGCAALGNSKDLPPFGLPKRLNPGIFLDPNTNDILVFVDTSDGPNIYRESVRIADIPLDTPFSLAILLNGRVLEIYLNCGLEATKVLSGDPRTVENVWYGLSGSKSADAQIQNLSIWNYGLTAEDIRSFCSKTPPKFTKTRPQCNGTDISPNPPNIPKEPMNVTDLGFGARLNTCP